MTLGHSFTCSSATECRSLFTSHIYCQINIKAQSSENHRYVINGSSHVPNYEMRVESLPYLRIHDCEKEGLDWGQPPIQPCAHKEQKTLSCLSKVHYLFFFIRSQVTNFLALWATQLGCVGQNPKSCNARLHLLLPLDLADPSLGPRRGLINLKELNFQSHP